MIVFHYNSISFTAYFLMDSSCKDRDIFAETPFDDVYAQKYDPVYIKNMEKMLRYYIP